MASNSSCGCMGALRCIAGPIWHCPMPPANPDDYLDFPFYTGPCPPCKGDGCRHHHHCCCHHHDCHHHGCHHHGDGCRHTRCHAAMFTADAPLSVEAGDAIPLTPQILNGECFESCSGCVKLCKSGLYHVVWTLNVPSYQNLCTRIYLSLNGNEIRGSSQTICCQADNTSASISGQAMVQTPPGGLLCLNTESAICFDSPCSVENVFTLSITKVE